jgi:lysophospholipase L1-like esterase
MSLRKLRAATGVAVLALPGLALPGLVLPGLDQPGATGEEPPAPASQVVTTWGASDDIAGGTLTDMTVRNIVHTSVGGTDLRIRISNAHGDQPLTFDSAYVGRQQEGAAIIPGTNRRLTFGGATSVTLPPGAMALSDPLPGRVEGQQNLTVSLHLVGTSGVITAHNRSMQHTFKSTSGDHAADETATAYATQSSAWFFLNAVLVTTPDTVHTVAALGDSITSAVGSAVNENHRWPDLVADRLAELPEQRRLAIANEGISGNRVLGGIAKAGSAGPSALARLDRDVLTKPGVRTVVLLEGINDVYAGASADAIIAGYRQIIARVRASGRCIVGGTLLPVGGSFVYTPEKEAARQAVNAFVRSSGEFDAVIDFDLATRDPAEPSRLLAAYDDGDGLHPSDEGNQAMADAVDLADLRCE